MAPDVAVISASFRGRYMSTNVAIKWPLARRLIVEGEEAEMTAWSHSSRDTIFDDRLSLPNDPDEDFLKLELLWLLRSSTPTNQEELMPKRFWKCAVLCPSEASPHSKIHLIPKTNHLFHPTLHPLPPQPLRPCLWLKRDFREDCRHLFNDSCG